MDIDGLIAAAKTIDRNNMVLIVLFSAAATYLIREFLRPPLWVTILAFPLMLFSAWSGVAAFKAYGIFISNDVGANTVIAAASGMIICFIFGAIALRLLSEFTDTSNYGPYRASNKDDAARSTDRNNKIEH